MRLGVGKPGFYNKRTKPERMEQKKKYIKNASTKYDKKT